MKNHPTVIWFNENSDNKSTGIETNNSDYQTLKDMAFCAGADDCGIADIDSDALQDEKKEILSIYPETKAVMSIVIKLNRENVRCVSAFMRFPLQQDFPWMPLNGRAKCGQFPTKPLQRLPGWGT